MEKVDVLIVGADVVGLATASEIARKDREIFVLEKERDYGLGISSRNSEVIHAGIYYPKGSLKAKLCVKGNAMTYRICEENKIAHKRIGKIIVATNEEEVKEIERLMRQGKDNGVRDLAMIDAELIHQLEPKVKATAAIYSPSTGILNAHGLMNYFYRKARQNSLIDPLILDTEVTNIKRYKDGYKVDMVSVGERCSIEARIVVNAAGLHADRIAEMAGIDIDREQHRLHWCKGDYFSLAGEPPVRMLVYLEPPEDGTSLGIHATPDLTGRVKFGPNAYYVKEINYEVESNLDEFWKSIITYLPMVVPFNFVT